MSTEQAGLYAKLAEVTAACGYVQKTGFNSFHKYKYVTEADLIAEVRAQLTQRNVAMVPSVTEITERQITTDKGKVSTVTTVKMEFTFLDGETGAMYTASWAGAGDASDDKGIYKAYTGALKYFLMKTFLIATGDDPEADQPAAPTAPTEPPITGARAEFITRMVSAALSAGLEPTDLPGIFTDAGAHLPAINKASIATISEAQATKVATSLEGITATLRAVQDAMGGAPA